MAPRQALGRAYGHGAMGQRLIMRQNLAQEAHQQVLGEPAASSFSRRRQEFVLIVIGNATPPVWAFGCRLVY